MQFLNKQLFFKCFGKQMHPLLHFAAIPWNNPATYICLTNFVFFHCTELTPKPEDSMSGWVEQSNPIPWPSGQEIRF